MEENVQPLNRQIIARIKEDPSLIIALFKEKGYDFYENGVFNTNNFGIRVSLTGSDFNDVLGSVFKELNLENAPFVCEAFEATTDPGTHYLENPMNYKGTAILAHGQYKGYKIDKHRGLYDALCQRTGKVKVYRDNNKNNVAEIDLDSLDEGMFGINIHKNSKYEAENDHNKFSAGCQETHNDADYDDWMKIQYAAEKEWGNNFTYTLFCIEEDEEAFKKVFPDLFGALEVEEEETTPSDTTASEGNYNTESEDKGGDEKKDESVEGGSASDEEENTSDAANEEE